MYYFAKAKSFMPSIVVLMLGMMLLVSCAGQSRVSSGVNPKGSVEEYSWEELSLISSELASISDENELIEVAKQYRLVNSEGELDGTQLKTVALQNGIETQVQIIGFNHDEKTDGGVAGISFIFKDCPTTHVMNEKATNIGGWEQSEMRSWLNSEFIEQLPTDLQNVISAAEKHTNNKGGYIKESANAFFNETGESITSDNIWLLSLVEVWGETAYNAHAITGSALSNYYAVVNSEGAQYKLFQDYGIGEITEDPFDSNSGYVYKEHLYSDEIAVKRVLDGSYKDQFYGDEIQATDNWWLRSPLFNSVEESFWAVGAYANGAEDYELHWWGSSDSLFGVAPGFCL